MTKSQSSITLIGIFTLSLAALSARSHFTLDPLTAILFLLATLRGGRMIAYDLVMAWFRAPFAKTRPDPTGAGLTTMPISSVGFKSQIANLLTCPICAGTWFAAGLAWAFAIYYPLGYWAALVFGAAGAAEIGQAVIEYFQWNGQVARETAGRFEIERRERHEELKWKVGFPPAKMTAEQLTEHQYDW